MALFENFPYTNLHELNLEWLINELQQVKDSVVLSVNGQTGEVILYQNAEMVLPDVSEDHWSILRLADGTHRGIMFANDGTAYIVSGNMMNHIYSVGNEPPYPVLSVNGLTGQIELYTEQYVRLPNLTGNDLINWNFYRTINNVIHGIQFETNGKAYIMHGSNRYQIYDSNDQPPYPVRSVNGQTGDVNLTFPVTSVNGQTGDVEVYTEEAAGYIQFPDVDSSGVTELTFSRSLNNVEYGLVFTDAGDLKLKIGNAEYNIYTEYDPGLVDSATDNNLNFAHNATGSSWGLMRDTTIGPVGILFSNTVQNSPEAYIRYRDSNNTYQTLKILTPADIPSSSGVVSVNGLNGVVVLSGANLNVSTTDTRKINVAIETIEDDIEDLENALVYVENTNTATHNIPVGSFVYWNKQPYISLQAISTGDTLSSTNLGSPIAAGGMINSLNNNIVPVLIDSSTASENSYSFMKCGNVFIFQLDGVLDNDNPYTITNPAYLPTGTARGIVSSSDGSDVKRIYCNPLDGKIKIASMSQNTGYYGEMVWIKY